MARTCVVDAVSRLVVNVVELGATDLPRGVVEQTAPPPGFLFVPHDVAGPGWIYGLDLSWTNPAAKPPATSAELALQQLQLNDAAMFRMLEALVDVLLAKGTIVGTDFTAAIRQLYQNRKALRAAAGVP
jgi:hypothetical protein